MRHVRLGQTELQDSAVAVSTRAQEPVAVLGIGAMGHGMATSLLRAGIPTIVWNRRPEAARDLAGLGAEVAEAAADAAREAPIVARTGDPDGDPGPGRQPAGVALAGRQAGPDRQR